MPERLLRIEDIRFMNSADHIAAIFQRLGYNARSTAQPLSVRDLELPARSAEAIWDAHLIADQQKGNESLQVLLFQLQSSEWESPSLASQRMRSIASSLCRRPSNFLLLGTRNYDQLMLVNPRKSFDAQMNLKVGIRKLLIDRTNPTHYDRDRLEAIAARNHDPQALYKVQCEAFDVEKLTKTFYQDYRTIFEQVQAVIKANNAHPYFDDPSRLHQFAQRLLGRIMFLYFLQKKGFLAGDRDFLKTQYGKYLKSEAEETDFYDTVLEPLFFDILNRQRPGMQSPWGKIPYLNGGLFDRDYGKGVTDPTGCDTPLHVTLPNALFDPTGEKGILKFFNRYNFTIAENIQGDEDVAVDPEMLGKVFENLLAAEERGQSGTFYTPRGIVQFMCVESLSRYLSDETGIDLETIRQLTEFDPEWTDSQITKLLTKEQAKRLKQALESVKVCDPAVGSGAFPMGMMQVILAVKQAIARREGMTVQRGSLTMSQWKRDIIANNLYGVDIKPEAVEIAKLRMWLSMVVDIPDIEDVEPLPNLDYKLMCGNSLISTIHGEQMIPDPTKDQQGMLNVTPIQSAIQALVRLQQQYFDAQTDDRRELALQIRAAEKNVFRVAIADRRQYWQSEQRKLQQDIQRMGKASKAQTQKQQTIATKLEELKQIEVDVERGLRSVDFFQWHLHFHEVFVGKGGFDVVIGNPPYVRQEKLADQFKQSLKVEFSKLYKGTSDLYTYFYGRGVELLRSDGNLAFITSNKWFRRDYGSNLRKYIGDTVDIKHIVDFGELPVFDASTFPMIFIAQKGKNIDSQSTFTQVESLESPYPNITEIIDKNGRILPKKSFEDSNWVFADKTSSVRLDKMRETSICLSKYVEGKIFVGLKTGFNKAFWIDSKKRQELIEKDSNSLEIIKPLAVGDDARRWRIDSHDKWIIYAPWQLDIEKYPAIKEHLIAWHDKLCSRPECKMGRYNWWCLARYGSKYIDTFEMPKIVYPNLAKEPRFSFDTQGKYIDMTAFVISSSDLYLLGVLNSASVWDYLKQTSEVFGNANKGGRLELKILYTSKIPIPHASPSDRQIISALVQQCLDARGQGVEDWEAEINDRVAHLYGLTSEEIAIISGE
jgi:type I restriction-modification system DNA methylase subunit